MRHILPTLAALAICTVQLAPTAAAAEGSLTVELNKFEAGETGGCLSLIHI